MSRDLAIIYLSVYRIKIKDIHGIMCLYHPVSHNYKIYSPDIPSIKVRNPASCRKPPGTSWHCVCQVREVRKMPGNSLYPLKSQGKVREFSDKSGNFSDIRKSFLENSKWKKEYQNFDKFKNFLLRGQRKKIRKSWWRIWEN